MFCNDSQELKTKLGEQYRKESDIAKFMDELIYGKEIDSLNMNGYFQKIILYLHQTTPDILIVTHNRSSDFAYIFNLNVARLTSMSPQDQENYKINLEKTLLIKEDQQELTLIFPSHQSKADFIVDFRQLQDFVRKLPKEVDPLLLKHFLKADSSKNLHLSLEETEKFLFQLNLGNKKSISEILIALKIDGKKEYSFRDFKKLFQFLEVKKQFLEIFKQRVQRSKFTKNLNFGEIEYFYQPVMEIREFQKFLRQIQQENEEGITKICSQVFKDGNKRISYYQFCLFLTGPLNCIVNDDYFQHPTQENKPLNHYFCFSSKKTYLSTDRVSSKRKRYEEDLQSGVRHLQIDCFDHDSGPVVAVSQKTKKSLSLSEVLLEIKQFCDKNLNHTPIILCINNNCTGVNMKLVAKKLQTFFGEKIIRIQSFSKQLADLNNDFPTLKQLRGRIIIRNVGSIKLYQSALDSQNVSENQLIEEQHIRTKKITQGAKNKKKQEEPHRFILIQMLAMTGILICKNIDVQSVLSCWESFILTDAALREDSKRWKLSKKEKVKKDTYSSWLEVTSSSIEQNIDPLLALEYGAHFIPIRTQICDIHLQLLNMFFLKGHKNTPGYRLKPISGNQDKSELKQDFKVSITPISASFIFSNQEKKNRQIIPTVTIRMKYFGMENDSIRNHNFLQWKQFTTPITDNAFNPVFHKPLTMTLRLTAKQIGFLAIEIKECGYGIIPVQCMRKRKGYRYVHLYDSRCEPKQSKVILRFQ